MASNEAARRIQQSADDQYQRIRARSRDLSPRGRDRELYQAYLGHKEQMDKQLAARDTKPPVIDTASLKRELFGIDDLTDGASVGSQGSLQMSYRDAKARAAAVGSDFASITAMLKSAQVDGDELQVRACANVLLEQVITDPRIAGDATKQFLDREYLAARPHKAAAAVALANAASEKGSARLQEQFQASLDHMLAVPVELQGRNSVELAQLLQDPVSAS